MGLNMLGYHFHVLQRCHPVNACGHEGILSSHLYYPVLALWIFIATQVQHSYNSSNNGLNFTCSRSQPFSAAEEAMIKILPLARIELTTSALLLLVGVL